MSRFASGNFAVMRHAVEGFLGGEIEEQSRIVCVRVIRELAQKISGRSVKIFHSPLPRARSTAVIVRDELVSNGIIVEAMTSLEWLRCDAFAITNSNVTSVLSPDDNSSFGIFISHMPDVEEFLGLYGVSNCSLYSRDFIVRGH